MEYEPTPSCSKKPDKSSLQNFRNKITGPCLCEQIRKVVNNSFAENALKKQVLDVVDLAINCVQIFHFENQKHKEAKKLQISIANLLNKIVQESVLPVSIVSVIEEEMEFLCKKASGIKDISISRFKWIFEQWEKLKCLHKLNNEINKSSETQNHEDSNTVSTPTVTEDDKIPEAPSTVPDLCSPDSFQNVPLQGLLPSPVKENAPVPVCPEQMKCYPYSIIDCRKCETCKKAFKIKTSIKTKRKALSKDFIKCQLSKKMKCEGQKMRRKKKKEEKRRKLWGEIADENKKGIESVSKPMEVQAPILEKIDSSLKTPDDSLLNHTLLLRKFTMEVEEALSLLSQVSCGYIACDALEMMPQPVFPPIPDNFASFLVSGIKPVNCKNKRFNGLPKALSSTAKNQNLRCDVRSYVTCNEGMLLNAISKILDFSNIDTDEDALNFLTGATCVFLRKLTAELQRESCLWYKKGTPPLVKDLNVFPVEQTLNLMDLTLKHIGISGISSIQLHMDNVFETHQEALKKSIREFKRLQRYHRRVKLFFKKLEDFGSTLQKNDIVRLANECMKKEPRKKLTSLNNDERPDIFLKRLQNVMKNSEKEVLALQKNKMVEYEQKIASLEEQIASEESRIMLQEAKQEKVLLFQHILQKKELEDKKGLLLKIKKDALLKKEALQKIKKARPQNLGELKVESKKEVKLQEEIQVQKV